MSELTVREYRPEDIAELSALWRDCFGDGERFIAEFFRLLPHMGTGAAALSGGRIVGAAYALCGMELVDGEKKPPICGYIYAVAVAESFRGRGLGRRLSLEAAELAKKRGASIICTLPAELSLYKWYEEILGLKCALYRSRTELKSAPLEPCMALSATEYMLWRENMLQGKPHLRLSYPSLELQRILCREYGGGLYACGSGIAAAYREGETGLIRELICMDEGQRERLAASIGAALGVERVQLFQPTLKGEPYIAATPDAVPANCLWNLSFD